LNSGCAYSKRFATPKLRFPLAFRVPIRSLPPGRRTAIAHYERLGAEADQIKKLLDIERGNISGTTASDPAENVFVGKMTVLYAHENYRVLRSTTPHGKEYWTKFKAKDTRAWIRFF
jgi:hypothetical protein